MRPDRAWVRLRSGKHLDLLDPTPAGWEDADLAIGLSRTYRWGGHSRWELPLSVAQHSLLVLVLRQQMQPHQPLDRAEALRELLHDGQEGLLSFDPISPVKPHLGRDFEDLAGRLQAAIATRYRIPAWSGDDHVLHRRADRLAAASEAVHVAGWSVAELHDTLNITLAPLVDDPLPHMPGFRPWEPWPAQIAASLFLFKLRELTHPEWTPGHPADLEAAMIRTREVKVMAEAFDRLPESKRKRCQAPTGSLLTDTWVTAEADNGTEMAEGLVVGGERDEDGQWLLDEPFTIFTPDKQLIRCRGHNCHVVAE